MLNGPLSALPTVTAARWPAAAEAAALLAALGARVEHAAEDRPALAAAGVTVVAEPADAATDWARSGAMALTGRPDGPPLHSTGRPATTARGAALAFELLTGLLAERGGSRVAVDGAALLGERAALLGLHRRGPVAAGGGARLLRAADGWWVLNLARPDDAELVPALIHGEVDEDPWEAVRRWSATVSAAEAVERATLLGVPTGLLAPPAGRPAGRPAGPRPAPPRPWVTTFAPGTGGTGGVPLSRPPVVVNLGALWAAPLGAQLLGIAGARVIDVESTRRPDGARFGDPAFYELLHRGNASVRLDFASADGRRALHELMREADAVIEASRPRALAGLGLAAEDLPPGRRPRVWARITGHGRGAGAHRVAFGDDAAVAGGLVAWDSAGPVFAGDAIADPLTGLHTAVAVAAGLLSDGSWTIDLTMRDIAARAVHAGATVGGTAAQPPRARSLDECRRPHAG